MSDHAPSVPTSEPPKAAPARLGFLERNPGLRSPLGLVIPLLLLMVVITPKLNRVLMIS